MPDLAEHNTLRVETVPANTTTAKACNKASIGRRRDLRLDVVRTRQAHYVWACFDQPTQGPATRFTVTRRRVDRPQ